MRSGSPPSAFMASRMAARSTTTGTPVKSWRRTRLGMKPISFAGFSLASQEASASTSAARAERPSSFLRRFSSSTFMAKGSRATSPLSFRASIR